MHVIEAERHVAELAMPLSPRMPDEGDAMGDEPMAEPPQAERPTAAAPGGNGQLPSDSDPQAMMEQGADH